jgi:hypothetical protein
MRSLDEWDPHDQFRYDYFFGEERGPADYRVDTVRDVFRAIRADLDREITWRRATSQEIAADTEHRDIAYSQGRYYPITFYPAFWGLSPTPGHYYPKTDSSQPGVIVHELSHWQGTSDYDGVYGTLDCHEQAVENPDEAIKTADCYRCFAEELNPV